MKQEFYLLILLMLGVSACDPCTGCGPLAYEPTVELIFMDVTVTNNVKTQVKATDVSIYWEEVLSVIEFEADETNFITPLSRTDNVATYTITIGGLDYALELGYQPDQQLDIDHRMIVRALNIDTLSHSFDSLFIECGSFGCLDKETTITCYF